MLSWIGARRRSATIGRVLYDKAVLQARSPGLYSDLGAPDTVEGRFEVLTLHVLLLLHRLKTEGPEAAPLRQEIFDTYIADLDGALREMGVGDLSVGKRMKSLGEAFYGRAAAYEAAFEALPDRSSLEDLVARTILGDNPDRDGAGLAGYILTCRLALANATLVALCDGQAPWPSA
jgi:cytochrome b pre-mRNA-processing protein 3